ncbi:TetR family transcriptional regulator [Corynebacterium sp. UBA2622]|uniref:TetR family transcriptional regulator n=1 Tax=Corynebacterium sp. UBA2622 TaxID=1946393 RepID=UPI0025C3BC93|nr:TetR family transcriptional regulator [Corynebacterium sp. UBA2622]
MQLSRGAITRVALDILDEYGLADVSMRRIATVLGVAPGALYWHIQNKQELISNLAALVIAPLVDAPPAEPAEVCARLRAALLAHRDGAEVVIAAVSQPDSPVGAQLGAVMLGALGAESEGASKSDRLAAVEGLMYMTLGAAYVHQSTAQLAQATGGAAAERAPGDARAVNRAIGFLLAGLGPGVE